MKSFLEFDDAGAGSDEPAKGVTIGHIRAWHDDHTEQGERLREEIKTVGRIWDALDIKTFAAAGGLAIFEIVARQKEALEQVHHTLCAHGHVDAYTELHAFIQTALDPTASKRATPYMMPARFGKPADAIEQKAENLRMKRALEEICADIKPELCNSELELIAWWGQQVTRLQSIAASALSSQLLGTEK